MMCKKLPAEPRHAEYTLSLNDLKIGGLMSPQKKIVRTGNYSWTTDFKMTFYSYMFPPKCLVRQKRLPCFSDMFSTWGKPKTPGKKKQRIGEAKLMESSRLKRLKLMWKSSHGHSANKLGTWNNWLVKQNEDRKGYRMIIELPDIFLYIYICKQTMVKIEK